MSSDERQQLVIEGMRTVSEAVDFTHLSRSMLYELMETGRLAYAKIGRRRLIPHRALVELMGESLVVRSAAI